jgi:hypothetical protein
MRIIDWLGKNLGRLKTIGIIILLVLFFISTLRNGCDRVEAEEMVERITGLNIQNDLLFEDIKRRDTLLIAKDERIKALKDSLNTSEGRIRGLTRVYVDLEEEYRSLSDSLLTVPVDTSYTFLTEQAYPHEGKGRYPFNEPQVKGIHLTFLEKIKLDKINLNLLSQITEKDYQLDLKDTVVSEQSETIMLMAETRQDLDSIIFNKDEIIEIQGEQIHKKQKGKTFWQVVSGVFFAIITALAVR